jgi:autotransporter-associated beta strand protein
VRFLRAYHACLFSFSLLLTLFGNTLPASGQVVINEVMAANSDRLLQRTSPGYPRLGITTPWYLSGYDDSLWSTGNGPFGFGTFSGVTLGKNTSAAMQNKLAALYVRKAFPVTAGQAGSTNELQLVTRFNDGFIAFVNGVEVARRNMGNPGMFAYRDQTAFNTNVPSAAAIAIGLGMASNRLFTGTNILCIQTHNKTTTSGDFLSMADLRIGGTAPVSLVTNSAAWKYFAGVSEPSGGLIDYGLINGLPQTVTWATLGYNDSSWPQSKGPFGYDRNVPVHYLLGTNLTSQMYNIAASVYARTLFSATTAEAASSAPLQLILDYDDGIIVYLNGREVARRNVGTDNTITPYSTLAAVSHGANGEGGATNLAEVIFLGAANTLLSGGDNVLALQVHNSSLGSSDLIGRATLSTTGASPRTLTRPEDTGSFFIGTSEPQAVTTGDEGGEDVDFDTDTPDSESDWIELYNGGAQAVNLTGWSLTDDDGKPRKWYFPAGSSIASNGYLVVMCTGFDVGPINGATYLHTNFKLSSSGEYMGLIDAAGTIASEIAPTLPAQSYFHTYVRNRDGQYLFSDTATPGAANTGNLFTAISSPPNFSHLGGFFSTSFSLQLTSPDPSATIRYTLNGSEPSATNALYSAPLSITSNTTVRARCYKAGEVPSPLRTYNYLVAQSAARRSLPALCFTGDQALSLYGTNNIGGPVNGEGIMAIKGGGFTNDMWSNYGDMSAFSMPLQNGRSAERAVGFEYYPTSGVPLRTDLGLRISGSPHARPRYRLTTAPTARFSPTSFYEKPSFNFFFRGELGESPQDYAFFPESRVTKFEDMRLRAGKNDVSNPFIKDELMRRIYIGTGQEGARGTVVSIYMNGVWKGYFNFCEHLREAFMQQHYGSAALWDVIQTGTFANGDAIHWNNTFAFLRTNDLTAAANYVKAQEYVDADNIADYVMVNAYAAMWDWPHNNWVAARERSTTGLWRFYMWDGEGGFGSAGWNPATFDSFSGDLNGDGVGNDSGTSRIDIGDALALNAGTAKDVRVVYTRLRSSPEFRLRFADRAQKHLFHGGCLTRESMEANYFMLRNLINPIMQETISQTMNESFYTSWIVAGTRRTAFFNQLLKYGLWFATLAPEYSQHGGEITTNTWLSITNPNASGNIYYTTNGSDPRALGGAVTGRLYTSAFKLPISSLVKARVLGTGGEWSPVQEAAFVVVQPIPEFLPSGSADWTADANWNSAPKPYPNGTNSSALINAPATADREVSLRAPVTVGSLTILQNDSAFRNKIRDRSTGNTLTFQVTNAPAKLTINGAGTGYVEFEVAADTVLASSLRVEVNNTAGSSDYGALRLRANWRGPGGLAKEGDGVATLTGEGKSYTGATVINQGVLAFTEPASPYQSVSVSVTDGGQLRLTSASTAGEPRVYRLGGALTLNSLGRGGTLPPSGQGVSGALRYQPDADDSTAIVTNPVALAGLSAMHVEGSRNTLELSGALSGPGGLVKTGGGNLILSAQSRQYVAPVIVSNGTLTVNGRILSAVGVAADGTLAGCGQLGPVSGAGTVALDRTILSSPMVSGLNYAFVFGAKGSPAYASRTSSGNSVLHTVSIHPGAGSPSIDIYLDAPGLTVGDRLRGGFFVESGFNLAGFLDSATVRFFQPDAGGAQTFASRFYSPYGEALPISVTAMPETADFGDGPHQGYAMELRVAGAPARYGEWMRRNYMSPEDQSNPLVSAPMANLQNDGVPNLLKYAFNIARDEPAAGRLPRFMLDNGTPVYQFRFDPGKNDLVYLVEAASSLSGWTRTLFDSRTDDPALWNWDGESLFLSDEGHGPASFPAQFYRLRVIYSGP